MHHQTCPYVGYAAYGVGSGVTSALGVWAAGAMFKHRGSVLWATVGSFSAAAVSDGIAMAIAGTRDGKPERFSTMALILSPALFATLGYELGPRADTSSHSQAWLGVLPKLACGSAFCGVSVDFQRFVAREL
jgi:hypothetical protein